MTFEQMMHLFRKLTGHEPTAAEVEEAQAERNHLTAWESGYILRGRLECSEAKYRHVLVENDMELFWLRTRSSWK
jgi:hypothetical protein